MIHVYVILTADCFRTLTMENTILPHVYFTKCTALKTVDPIFASRSFDKDSF